MLFSRRSERSTKVPERTPEPAPEPERAPALEPPRADSAVLTGPVGAPTQSFIDASLTIVGDLHSPGDVRIDGRICGNVRCTQLVVGRDAAITGSVVAQQAIVRGRLVGTIRAPAVVIQDTAHVESEITYRSLSIDEGAFFEGAARRRDDPLSEPEQLAAAGPASTASVEAGAAAPGAADAADKGAADGPPPLPGSKAPAKPNGQAPIANGHSPAA